MKIAFIGTRGVNGKYSGIETYCEEVGSRLVKRGHEVTVYCRSYPGALRPAGFLLARGTPPTSRADQRRRGA